MKRRNFLHNTALGSAAVFVSPLSLMKEDKIDWSLEIERCKNDPVYFVETYCKRNGKPALLTNIEKEFTSFFHLIPVFNKAYSRTTTESRLFLLTCELAHGFIFQSWTHMYSSTFKMTKELFEEQYQNIPHELLKPDVTCLTKNIGYASILVHVTGFDYKAWELEKYGKHTCS